MPSHVGGQAPVESVEMPPPLVSTEVVTQAPPLHQFANIDQFGMVIIVVTVIIAGIFIYKVLRRKKK